MPAQGGSREGGRIDTVDGARGAAMLVVFLAHFADAYYEPLAAAASRHALFALVTRIASPAFVWISGTMLGLLYTRNRDRFGPVRDRLIDRGLFLILVGHPLIAGATSFRARAWWVAARELFITDTLGISLILGTLLVTRLRPRTLALCGLGLLAASWTLVPLWAPPIGGWAWRMKDLLLGDWRKDWLAYNFPPLPWLGYYLVATGVGSTFARLTDEGRGTELRRGAVVLGVGAVLAAVYLKAALRYAAGLAPLAPHARRLVHLGSFTEKLPPGPGYIFFYGGLALLMFAGIVAWEGTRLGRAVNRWNAVLGRASLASFVAQFYVYYVAVFLLPRPPEALAPLYFLATVVLLRLLASAWDRAGANRFITVGYPALAARWAARRHHWQTSREHPTGAP